MDQRLHFITVATASLDAARAFYGEGLGWTPLMDLPGEILFYQVAPGLLLGLFETGKFNEDLATGTDYSAVCGLTLAHNVESRELVEQTVADMKRAGGTTLKAPQQGAFGGVFHAHVQDPNGIIWEIAHNPNWHIADNGTVVLN